MTPARALSLGLLLTATAGFSDGLGFIALGGFYTSFMSGNTTQVGAGLATGSAEVVALAGSLVLLFFIGSFIGSLAAQASQRWGTVACLAIVVLGIAVALALSAAGYSPEASLPALAAAAGAQNAVLQPIGAARLGTTFVTGTLFAAGQDLARATRGEAPPWRWAQHILVWAALALGAAAGALAFVHWRMLALVLPMAVYVVCLIWFVVGARRSVRRQ